MEQYRLQRLNQAQHRCICCVKRKPAQQTLLGYKRGLIECIYAKAVLGVGIWALFWVVVWQLGLGITDVWSEGKTTGYKI